MYEYVYLILAQVLAYFTGSVYFSENVLVTQNPSDISNSVSLFFYIIAATVLFLFLLHFFRKGVHVLEGLAIFFSSEIFFGAFLFFPLDLLLAGILVYLRFAFPRPRVLNTCLFFSVVGVAGILGASLDVLPVFLFAVILMVYDLVSVFITRHMVYLAREVTSKPTALLASFEDKRIAKKRRRKRFMIGGGDIVVPSLIFTSLMLRGYFLPSVFVLIFSALGLSILKYLLIKYNRPLPALVILVPFSLLGCIFGVVLGWLLGI